jgi:chain length determinant protein EpsF
MLSGYVDTQADIITSTGVALKAVDALKLADSPKAKEEFQKVADGEGSIRDWLAEALLSKITIEPGKDSSVLTINFKGRDPQFVADVANAFADAYVQLTVEIKTKPAQQASAYIGKELELFRQQYEQAQNKLSAYQQQNNIFSADKQFDVETSRLNDLSTQLVQAQSAMMDATSRQNQANGNPDASYDIQSVSLIQNLKASLATAEGKFADLKTRMAPNHPLYIAAKSEVDRLRSQLDEQTGLASKGISSNARAATQRVAELKTALDAQKAKVLQLTSARDEFNVLTKEVENARLAYEVTSQRYTQTSLEGQSKQADIGIVSVASPPLKPSSPRLPLNLALSVLVGLMLGMGAALALEVLDPRVRSASQLLSSLEIPVLGVIEKPKLPGTNRYKLIRFGSNKAGDLA